MSNKLKLAIALGALLAIGVIVLTLFPFSETTSFKDNGEQVSSIAFSPDGKTLAVGSSTRSRLKEGLPEGIINLWNVRTGKLRDILWQSGRRQKFGGDTYNSVASLLFSPDGKILAGGDAIGYVLWQVETGKQIAAFEQGSSYSGMAFSPDGTIFATVSRSVHDEPGVRLWYISTGRETAWIKTGYVDCLALSPDGKLLVVAKTDVVLWDLASQTQLAKDELRYPMHVVRFTPDGKQLVAAGVSGVLEVYNLAQREKKLTLEKQLTDKQFSTVKFPTTAESMSFSKDAKWLATGNRSYIHVWETTGWKLLLTRPGSCPAFSPDDKFLAIGNPEMVQGLDQQHSYLRGEVKLFKLNELLEQK